MTIKRYRAHRALASVVLVWVTSRVVATHWPHGMAMEARGLPSLAPRPIAPPLLIRGPVTPSFGRAQRQPMAIGMETARGTAPLRVSRSAMPLAIHYVLTPAAPRRRRADHAPVSGIDETLPLPRVSSRWGLYAWMYLREGSASTSVAPNGQLGGSQAGLRATWRLTRDISDITLAASMRLSRPIAMAEGGEGAVGLEINAPPHFPVRLMAERRIRLEQGGRNAWSLSAASGVDTQLDDPHWRVETYAQAGIVGARRRDGFVDGAVRVSRRIGPDETMAAGVGLWGSVQPGVERIDVGPYLAGVLASGAAPIRWEVALRARVLGEARPATGLTFTLSGGF